jgi:hypothetical protein
VHPYCPGLHLNPFPVEHFPRECFIAIRDFGGNDRPVIITLYQEGRTGDSKKFDPGEVTRQSLRVRQYKPGFPIEWETVVDPEGKEWWGAGPLTKYNEKATEDFLIGHSIKRKPDILLLGPDPNGKGYRLEPFPGKYPSFSERSFFSEPIVGRTQKKEQEEYWGYYRKKDPQQEFSQWVLRRIYFNADKTDMAIEDILFSKPHPKLIGAGYFALGDLDGDGLDEVVVVEETGIRKRYHPESERLIYSDIADYIHVLKWDGKAYQSIWVSPPFKDRGSKVLIDDVLGNGKKQIVVGTGHGTLQVWDIK